VRVDPEALVKMVPLMVAAKPREPEAHELVLH
jgi:hypothetical protein